jgi:hypothetical protein
MHIVFDRAARTVHISQTAFIDQQVAKFSQTSARDAHTPLSVGATLSKDDSPASEEEQRKVSKLPYRELVGALLWAAAATRPDIAFAVGQLSQFLANWGRVHWNAALHVLRYLKTTRTMALTLGNRGPLKDIRIMGMTDSDFANCVDSRRSVGGYCFSIGGGAISWSSQKQARVTTSTTEAEYYAAADATKEALWLRSLLHEIGFSQKDKPTLIQMDNQPAERLMDGPANHMRTKHFHVDAHFVCERVADKEVYFKYVRSADNIADIFTKQLPYPQHARLRKRLGVESLE